MISVSGLLFCREFMRRLGLFSRASLCSINYVVVKTIIQKTVHYPSEKAPLPNLGNLPPRLGTNALHQRRCYAVIISYNRNSGNAAEPSRNWCLAQSTRGASVGSGVLPPEKFFEIVYIKSCNLVHFWTENGWRSVVHNAFLVALKTMGTQNFQCVPAAFQQCDCDCFFCMRYIDSQLFKIMQNTPALYQLFTASLTPETLHT